MFVGKIFYSLKNKFSNNIILTNKQLVCAYLLTFSATYSLLLYNAIKYDAEIKYNSKKNANPANYFTPF